MWISLSYLNKTNKIYIQEKTEAVAELIAVGITSALITDDIMTVNNIVDRSVAQIRDIYLIEVLDEKNRPIVSHHNDIPIDIKTNFFSSKEIPITISNTTFGKVKVIYDGITIQELIRRVGIELGTVALLGIISSAMFAYFASAWISRYLNEMTESISSLRNGESHEPLKWESQTELGKLAYSFNELVADLKQQRDRSV